jgi:hypothetical protein
MINIHKYKAVKEGENYTLYKDGVQAFCPKLPPMPIQGQFGKIEWTRFPCNTGCPFANVIENTENGKKIYEIKCEGAHLSHELSNTYIKEETPPISPIIIGQA